MRRKEFYFILAGILAVLLILSLIFIVPGFTNMGTKGVSVVLPSSPQTASTKVMTMSVTAMATKVAAIHISSQPNSTPQPPSTAQPTVQLTVQPTVQSTVQPVSTAPVQATAGQRVVTFANNMQQTVWVAAASTAGHTLPSSGWVLQAGQSVSTTMPDAWNGRFWGRTGCAFDANGSGHCETGDCASRFQCGQAWGNVPATLAEFNLNAYAGLDFYDVSLVDGSNLPMYINSYGGKSPDKISANGCSATGCTRNVNVTCPNILQIKNSSGTVIACDAACNVLHTDQYCCRGAYISRSMCDPTQWPVNYAKIFKAAEPFAYSYPDDDATSTLTCAPECAYRITFGVS